jgi:hypothetical protein
MEWAVSLAILAWILWPRRPRLTYLLAAPRAFEFTCGRTHYEMDRASIEKIVLYMSPPRIAPANPVSAVMRFTDGREWVFWRGSLDEAEAIAAALRRGLRMESDDDATGEVPLAVFAR